MKDLEYGEPQGPEDWSYVYGALKEIREASRRNEQSDTDISDLQDNAVLRPIKESDFSDAYDTVYLPAIRTRLRNIPDIFDYSGGVVADYTDALAAAEEEAYSGGALGVIRTLYFPLGDYPVASTRLYIRSGLTLIGEHPSMSQIVFSDTGGGFTWTGENNGGGGMHRLGLAGDFSGGNGSVMLRVGDNSFSGVTPQRFHGRDILITCRSGTVSYGIIVDGTGFPGDSGGMRAPLFDNVMIFNSTAIAFDNRYVRSAFYNNVNIFQGGGNNETLNFTGLADIAGQTRTSVGIGLTNIRCNDLIFDYANDICGAALAIETNISCSANTTNSQFDGKIGSFSNLGGATNVAFDHTAMVHKNVNF